MRRVVIDTNLYIDWLNAGRHEDVLFERDVLKYLSAVVMLELYAGALSGRDQQAVRNVVSAFDRAGRLLVPSGAVYEDAGHVLRALQRSGYQVAKSGSLVNGRAHRALGAGMIDRLHLQSINDVTHASRCTGIIKRLHDYRELFDTLTRKGPVTVFCEVAGFDGAAQTPTHLLATRAFWIGYFPPRTGHTDRVLVFGSKLMAPWVGSTKRPKVKFPANVVEDQKLLSPPRGPVNGSPDVQGAVP